MNQHPPTLLGIRSRNGLYAAEFLSASSTWMTGAIQGGVFTDDAGREHFAQAVVDNIVEVSPAEQAYSSCTDGRWRDKLEDGGSVPIREQLVGADSVTLFIMAEALGAHFYADPAAPVAARLRRVMEFARNNGVVPTTHLSCGAAGGFLRILHNSIDFIKNPAYITRQQALMTNGGYDADMHREIVAGHQARIAAGKYAGYSDALLTEVIRNVSGPHAVEQYIDDGRGVHGHRERAIVRLDERLMGVAISPNALAASTEDEDQAFGVNAGRIDRLARLLSRGDGDDSDYQIARLAAEDFASAGHGTLAQAGMETLVIAPAA